MNINVNNNDSPGANGACSIQALQSCVSDIPRIIRERSGSDSFQYHMRLVSADFSTSRVRIRIWGAHCPDCWAWERWVCHAKDLQGPDGFYFAQIREVYPQLREVLLVTQLDNDYFSIIAEDDPIVPRPASIFPDLPIFEEQSTMFDPDLLKKAALYHYHPFVISPVGASWGNRRPYFIAMNPAGEDSGTVLMSQGGRITHSWIEYQQLAAASNFHLERFVVGTHGGNKNNANDGGTTAYRFFFFSRPRNPVNHLHFSWQ